MFLFKLCDPGGQGVDDGESGIPRALLGLHLYSQHVRVADPDPFFYVEGWIRSISIPGLPALTIVTGVPYISATIHCKSRNLPNTDVHDYSPDLR